MDKGTVAVMIPVIVMLIPLAAVIFNGWQKIIKLRIDEARVTGGAEGSARAVEDLRGEMEQLRHELGDLQERLDFAERLLARQREAERLPGPRTDAP